MTLGEFVSELAKEAVTLHSAEVSGLTSRFGKKALLMGHLQEDGVLLIAIADILDAARSLESQTLAAAGESIGNEQAVELLQSGELFVDRVIAAREQRLRRMIRDFQNQPDAGKKHTQWKHIEKEVFGVEYPD